MHCGVSIDAQTVTAPLVRHDEYNILLHIVTLHLVDRITRSRSCVSENAAGMLWAVLGVFVGLTSVFALRRRGILMS